MTKEEQDIENAAEIHYISLSFQDSFRSVKKQVETAFKKGAKSEAAKAYWFKQFHKTRVLKH